MWASGPGDSRRARQYLPGMHLGFGETLVILVVALLVFGPNKLPQLGAALGKGLRNFKKAATEDGPGDAVPEGERSLPGSSASGPSPASEKAQA